MRCNFPPIRQKNWNLKIKTILRAAKLFSLLNCIKTELQSLLSELVSTSFLYMRILILSSRYQIYTLLHLNSTLLNVTIRDFLIDFTKSIRHYHIPGNSVLGSLANKAHRKQTSMIHCKPMGKNSMFFKVNTTWLRWWLASNHWQHHTSLRLQCETLKWEWH